MPTMDKRNSSIANYLEEDTSGFFANNSG
jgi:hypothetical protein